eukprot:scaffold1435_cov267-Pinguiococcus_pyrenoidosus.AAC.2
MPAYGSSLGEIEAAEACGAALLPLRTKKRGPAQRSPEGEVDIIDEALTYYRANVLFATFSMSTGADRTMAVSTNPWRCRLTGPVEAHSRLLFTPVPHALHWVLHEASGPRRRRARGAAQGVGGRCQALRGSGRPRVGLGDDVSGAKLQDRVRCLQGVLQASARGDGGEAPGEAVQGRRDEEQVVGHVRETEVHGP